MLNPKSMMAPSPAKSRDTGYIGSKFVGAGAAKKSSSKPAMAKPTMPMKNPISSLVGQRPTPIIGQGGPTIGGPKINPLPMTRPAIPPPAPRPEAQPLAPPPMNPAIMGGPAPMQRPMMAPNPMMNRMGVEGGGLGAYMKNRMQPGIAARPMMY